MALSPLPNLEWQVFPAPELTGDARTWTYRASALLTMTIGKTALPAMDWQHVPLLMDRPRDPTLGTWAWKYNQNLIGKDRFPPGKKSFDLSPKQIIQSYRLPDYSWAGWYNLKLIGKDRFPPGVQPGNPVLLLTPIGPREPFRSWSLGLVQTTLQPAPTPVGEQVSDLPPRPYQRLTDYSWADWYNLTLVAQDKLPTGEQVTDLPPRDPRSVRDWGWQLTLRIAPNFTGFSSNDWTPPPPLPELGRTWVANPTTLRVAVAPVGEQVSDRPAVPSFYRDWALSLTTATLFTPAMPPGMVVDERPAVSPFYRDWALNFALTGPTPFTTYNFDWPLPGRAPLPVPSWAWSYNLNLIGQDFLPVGDKLYDRPVLLPVEPATRTWALWLNLSTLNTPVGEQYYERPAPVTWLRDWALNLQLTTLAPVTTPFAQTYWPTPSGPQTPQRSWTFSYNLNLVGQDQLPKGEQVTDLPPPSPLRAENLKTWIEQTNLALLVPAVINIALPSDWQNPAPVVPIDPFWGVNPATLRAAPVVLPANQYDWPLPRAPQLPARGMAAGFPPELIGQDQLPRGAQVYDLAPRGTLPTDYRSWIYYTSLALNGSLGIPVGEQVFELAPRAALPASDLRTWVDRTKLALLVPFNQLDWPVPIGPLLPQRGVATFPSLALTTSVAPFAQTYWPLPIPPQLPQRTFTASFPLSLIGQDQFPPGRQVSELSPFGYPYPSSLRTGTVSPAVPPIVVVTAGGETLLMMGMG